MFFILRTYEGSAFIHIAPFSMGKSIHELNPDLIHCVLDDAPADLLPVRREGPAHHHRGVDHLRLAVGHRREPRDASENKKMENTTRWTHIALNTCLP